jgi:hypothetical protein
MMRAIAAPMPPVAPVTSAVLSVRSNMGLLILFDIFAMKRGDDVRSGAPSIAGVALPP